MKLELKPGEKVTVTFAGTDGEIDVEFGKTAVTVNADLPDSSRRVGEIYKECFGDASKADPNCGYCNGDGLATDGVPSDGFCPECITGENHEAQTSKNQSPTQKRKTAKAKVEPNDRNANREGDT